MKPNVKKRRLKYFNKCGNPYNNMKHPNKTFTITCNMNERWIPHFLGMLRKMQSLGELGGSQNITIYSDGDGDFKPKFEWNVELPIPAAPIKQSGGDTTYDAG